MRGQTSTAGPSKLALHHRRFDVTTCKAIATKEGLPQLRCWGVEFRVRNYSTRLSISGLPALAMHWLKGATSAESHKSLVFVIKLN